MERTEPEGSLEANKCSDCSPLEKPPRVNLSSRGRTQRVFAITVRFIDAILSLRPRHNSERPASLSASHPHCVIASCLLTTWVVAGCMGTYGMTEIGNNPYPLLSEDDSMARYGLPDDDVFIEVRRAPISRPIENLAVHYAALFPGGEIIRPGDVEEYLKIDGRNAFKVVFRPKYIRKRKRITETTAPQKQEAPEGWTRVTIEDPVTGKPASVLQGPVISRERILYLVAGESYVYYIFMRADGDSIEPARKRLEKLVREQIKYS
jgi:hypothetical protein